MPGFVVALSFCNNWRWLLMATQADITTTVSMHGKMEDMSNDTVAQALSSAYAETNFIRGQFGFLKVSELNSWHCPVCLELFGLEMPAALS
jgi:hypothetical protein